MVVSRVVYDSNWFKYTYIDVLFSFYIGADDKWKMKDDTALVTNQCLSDVRLCVTGGSAVGKSGKSASADLLALKLYSRSIHFYSSRSLLK